MYYIEDFQYISYRCP